MERRLRLTQRSRLDAPAAVVGDPSVAGMIERLSVGPVSLPVLVSDGAADGRGERLRALAHLAASGRVEELLLDETGEARAVVRYPSLVPSLMPRATGVRRLRPHSFLRCIGGRWLLACPSLRTMIEADDDALPAAYRSASTSPIVVAGGDLWASLLADHGFLQACDAPSASTDDWQFHDAIVHHAAESGMATVGGYGATFPHGDGTPPPHRPGGGSNAGSTITLPREPPPGVDAAGIAVLASRRSVRSFRGDPLPVAAIAQLLRSALATREVVDMAGGDRLVFRPYMSGGARGELAFLLLARRCEGIPYGLYWYMADDHVLERLDGFEGLVTGLIERLTGVTGGSGALPAAGLLIVADYARVAWKYEAIAYTTILRNVGAAYQALGIAATALGVGACAVGGGWAEVGSTGLPTVLAGRVVVGGMVLGLPAT